MIDPEPMPFLNKSASNKKCAARLVSMRGWWNMHALCKIGAKYTKYTKG